MHAQRSGGGFAPIANGAGPNTLKSASRSMHSAYAFQDGGIGGGGLSSINRAPSAQRFFLFETTSYCFIYWGLLSILLSPIAGFILMVLAFRERKLRTFSPNPSDWLVLFFIGLTMQGTMMAPFAFLTNPDAAYQQMVVQLDAGGEYFSAFVFPFLQGIYTLATIFMFIYYHNQYEDENGVAAYDGGFGSGSQIGGGGGGAGHRQTNAEAQKAVDTRNARLIKNEIEVSTRQKTEFIIPIAFAVGVVELVATRICPLTSNHMCGDRFLTFEVPKYAENTFYTISTINFMLLFVTFNTSNFFALTIYYQKLLQVREFRYIGTHRRDVSDGGNSNGGGGGFLSSLGGGAKNGNGYVAVGGGGASSSRGSNANRRPNGQSNTNDLDNLHGPNFANRMDSLANPENNSTWTITWRQIVIDMKRRPEIRAATNSTFPVVLMIILVAVTYICLYNLSGSGVAAFTTGFVCLITTCTCVVVGFVYITVQMADAVDYQTKVIAKLQNDMQVRLDEEGPEMDLFHRQLLMAKVRVLQSLDVYLRHSSSKPKLIGLSMESLRWTIIIIGLFMLNVFFFSLYYSHCANNRDS